ncbi:alpha/beta fold hydrolase [Streptacidiphilus jiangxiensis]|uniref:Pimeloyl-ACP methyl ester carboxylesterase n=1 Tax=Streptacidiphilus jiangxiensis TaxID=235985 RepID=A0A1H7Y9R0_STRJI|nr:alpha/beta hydrolase [Streptacidiphilus jiangxiensis]SEM42902.1 Pimeloyl-ACP methyl ester carboxylesterase [Streptacidiphilus jiangxiensis]
MSITITEHRYTADDGAALGYLRRGSGAPLICLPGGPGADVRYLGGLGGLDGHRSLVLVDQRATGRSPVPEDRSRCGYTAQAEDLEALRRHLGAESVDLLAHSAACLTAQEYAAAYPGRVRRLVLVTPVGATAREADAAEVAAIRARQAGEPWYAAAVAAEQELAGGSVDPERARELTLRTVPFVWGRWREEYLDLYRLPMQGAPDWYREAFYAGAPAPGGKAARLARLAGSGARPLVLAGGRDGIVGALPARRVAELHPGSRLVVLPEAGHRLWHEEPQAFLEAVLSHLEGPQ